MSGIVYQGTHFIIIKYEQQNKKTDIYYIYPDSDTDILYGRIKWYNRWRKYCFQAEDNIIWDSKCLTELINFLDKLNKDYKNKKKEH